MKTILNRIIAAFKVLFGVNKNETTPLIKVVEKDTEMYNLVQSKIFQMELSPLKEKIENMEKVMYFVTETLNSLSRAEEATKEMLVAQVTLNEEIAYTIEQIIVRLGDDGQPGLLKDVNIMEKIKKTILH